MWATPVAGVRYSKDLVQPGPMTLQPLRAALDSETSPKAAMVNLHCELSELLARRAPPVG